MQRRHLSTADRIAEKIFFRLCFFYPAPKHGAKCSKVRIRCLGLLASACSGPDTCGHYPGWRGLS